MANLLETEEDEGLYNDFIETVNTITNKTEELNILLLLNGPYDNTDCIL